MEITWQMVYLVGIADSVKDALLVIGFTFGIMLVAASVCLTLCVFVDGKDKRMLWIWVPTFFSIAIVTVGTLIPGTKHLAAIIAVPALVNNENVRALPDDVLGLAREWIDELRPKKEK